MDPSERNTRAFAFGSAPARLQTKLAVESSTKFSAHIFCKIVKSNDGGSSNTVSFSTGADASSAWTNALFFAVPFDVVFFEFSLSTPPGSLFCDS